VPLAAYRVRSSALVLLFYGCSDDPAVADAGGPRDASGRDGGGAGDDAGERSADGGSFDGGARDGGDGRAPGWFEALAEGTWIAIASDATIRDVLPDPIPHVDAHADNPASITGAWSGGAVDQVRGELILAGNGGHADYPGNEAYAIALREESPRWRRLSDPTPNDLLVGDDISGPMGAVYRDGRPRAMHATFECFGDGRVWFPFQNSFTSGGGGGTDAVLSYDRDSLGAAATPLAWTMDDLGPWRFHGRLPAIIDLSAMIFGGCAFDPVTHRVWALGGNSANYTVYWSVDTSGPTLGESHIYRRDLSFGHWGGWLAVAHDLRILVAGDHERNAITVLDLDRAGEGGDWTQIDDASRAGFFRAGSGGVYVAANHTIGAGDPRETGAEIHRLRIPTRVDGGETVYDPSGTWTWSTLRPGGAIPAVRPGGGNHAAHTKWNIVEDMGNGRSAIVFVGDIDGPLYVYKIPLEGL
jgi:hypothetical protein